MSDFRKNGRYPPVEPADSWTAGGYNRLYGTAQMYGLELLETLFADEAGREYEGHLSEIVVHASAIYAHAIALKIIAEDMAARPLSLEERFARPTADLNGRTNKPPERDP